MMSDTLTEVVTRVRHNPGDVVRRHRMLANWGPSKRPEAGEYEVLAYVGDNAVGDNTYHLVNLSTGVTYTVGSRFLSLVRKAAVPKEARRVYGQCRMGHSASLEVNADGSHSHFCERCLST